MTTTKEPTGKTPKEENDEYIKLKEKKIKDCLGELPECAGTEKGNRIMANLAAQKQFLETAKKKFNKGK